MSTADLSIEVNGMQFENPFILGSGPPGTNGKVISKSFDLGWGGCVIKTITHKPKWDHFRVHGSNAFLIYFQPQILISQFLEVILCH